MFIDKTLEFCDATALNTGAAGTYLVGNQIDLGAANQDLAIPTDDLYLVISVDTAFDSTGGAATAQFVLASDDAAAINTSTGSRHLLTKPFTEAEAVAGAVLFVGRLPYSEAERYERYLGLLQITAGEAFTAGKVNAFLTNTPPVWKPVPDAV